MPLQTTEDDNKPTLELQDDHKVRKPKRERDPIISTRSQA